MRRAYAEGMADQLDLPRLQAADDFVKKVLDAAEKRVPGGKRRYIVTPNSAVKSAPGLPALPSIAPYIDFARDELGWSGDAWRKAAIYLWAVDREPGVVLKNAANEPIAGRFQPTLRFVDVQGVQGGRFVEAEDAKGLASDSVTYGTDVRARALDAVLDCIEAYWRSLPTA